MTGSPGSERSSPHLVGRHGPHAAVFFALAVINGSTLAPAAQLNAEVINNPARELDIIVVTARKRAERSQEVPISIITLSAKELQRSHSYLPTEIVQSIPNMQL